MRNYNLSLKAKVVVSVTILIVVSHIAAYFIVFADKKETLNNVRLQYVADSISSMTNLLKDASKEDVAKRVKNIDWHKRMLMFVSDDYPKAKYDKNTNNTEFMRKLLTGKNLNAKIKIAEISHEEFMDFIDTDKNIKNILDNLFKNEPRPPMMEFDDPNGMKNNERMMGGDAPPHDRRSLVHDDMGRRPDYKRKRPRPEGFVAPPNHILVSIRSEYGFCFNVMVPVKPSFDFYNKWYGNAMIVLSLFMIVTSFVVVSLAVKPLSDIADVARKFGRDINSPKMNETGSKEVVEVARAMNEMKDRLRKYVETRTRMIGAISHDLRTPITRMRLRAEFIEDEEGRAKTQSDLDEMEKMISSVLEFAKGEELDKETAVDTDITKLIANLCDDYSLSSAKMIVKLPNEKISAMFKPLLTKRALSNLIDNAIKYAGGVEVCLNKINDDNVEIIISDNGHGIPEDELKNVFKPFYRVEKSRSKETGGTGLGLAVVANAIYAQGGEITLQNKLEPDHGLVAIVTLPL